MSARRLLLRLTATNLRRHRARWALTTFGVAIGVVSFTGVTALTDSIARSFERSVRSVAGAAQLQVSNGTAGVDADLVEEIRKVRGVESAAGRVSYGVAVPALGRRLRILGVVLGAEDAGEEASLDLPDDVLFLARSDSVAVPPALLEAAGWEVGATFDVQGPTGPRTLTVRGTLRAGGRLRTLGDGIGVMDAAAAQRLFGQGDKFDWVDVVVRPGRSVPEVRMRIAHALGGRAVVDTPLGRGRRMQAMLATLRTMLMLSGVVAMLVGVFLIYHTVKTATALRREELTTLWALGASRRQLSRYLLGEAVAVGLIGSSIGVAGGLAFATVALRSFGDVVAAMYAPLLGTAVRPRPAVLATGLGLGLLAVVAGAAVPCARPLHAGADGRRPSTTALLMLAVVGILSLGLGTAAAQAAASPVVGIRVAAVGTFAGLVFAGATLMVPAFVALVTPLLQRVLRRTSGLVGAWNWGQVRSRPGHTAVTIGALAAGVAFALGITTLLTSYRRDFVGWIDQTFVADVFVNAGQDVSLLGGPTLSLDLLDEIERLPGVRHAAPWRLLEVEFRGKPIIVQGMGEDAIDRAYPDLRLDHDAGEVVVSETLAERYHLAPGDHLALPAPVAPVDLTIRAVVPDYVVDLGNVKVGWRTFARHFAERSANVILVDAVPGTDVAALARRIERIVDGRWNAVTLTRAELRATVNALIEESFALTRALELLAVLVTICAMVNATSAAIIDRADELVTLRALGMRRRDVARLLMTEGGLLGLLGSLVGLLAGGLLGRTFVTTVARAVAGFRLALHWPLGTMIALVLLSTATAATAALIVGRRSVRRPAVLDAA